LYWRDLGELSLSNGENAELNLPKIGMKRMLASVAGQEKKARN